MSRSVPAPKSTAQLLKLNLSRLGLASAVDNVGDRLASGSVLSSKGVRAAGLVAGLKIQGADLVVSVLAEGISHVDQLVVLGNPAVGLADAAGDVVHAVGGRESQLSAVHEAGALAGVDKLVVHVDAAAGVGAG